MQTGRTPPLRSSPSTSVRFAVALAAALTALSCTDAPTPPEAPVELSARSSQAINIVLGDLDLRAPDALEDATSRSRFGEAIGKLGASLKAGRLDEAARNLRDARTVLSRAADLDTDGSGEADRTAILLALDVASTEITNARRGAAGGVR